MLWLTFSVLILLGVVVPTIAFLGALASNARAKLDLAIDSLFQNEFEKARSLVLAAVRLKPDLKLNSNVKALYEIIVSKDSSMPTLVEVRHLQSAINAFPKTKTEIIYSDKRFRFLLIAISLLVLLIRLVDLHRAFNSH